MKNQKLRFPIIILVAAIILMAAFAVVHNIALKPTITEAEFPFTITFELNGETETVNGVCAASYVGNNGYVQATTRQYEGVFTSPWGEVHSAFEIFVGDESSITLYTRLYPDYLMGDPEYDYFDEDTFYEPLLAYSNWATGETAEGLELPEHNAKIISWEYPQPIENSFEFSHIAHMSSADTFPMMGIAALALLLVMIFVKKEKDLVRKNLDNVSLGLNILIAVVLLPFVSVYGIFIDINGSEAAISHQMGYFVPAMVVLGLAASISLRRKGFSKSSFIAQFAGVVLLALHLLLSQISYWLS